MSDQRTERPQPAPQQPPREGRETWRPASQAPDGETLMTRINDAAGMRNEQPLVRRGQLWWTVDGSMYVYYTPTEYRPLRGEA